MGEDPNKKFKDEAIAADKLATLSTEAMTALSTCLKARVPSHEYKETVYEEASLLVEPGLHNDIRLIRRHQQVSIPDKQRKPETD